MNELLISTRVPLMAWIASARQALLPRGIRTMARQPKRAAAQATPLPWLPSVAVIKVSVWSCWRTAVALKN